MGAMYLIPRLLYNLVTGWRGHRKSEATSSNRSPTPEGNTDPYGRSQQRMQVSLLKKERIVHLRLLRLPEKLSFEGGTYLRQATNLKITQQPEPAGYSPFALKPDGGVTEPEKPQIILTIAFRKRQK